MKLIRVKDRIKNIRFTTTSAALMLLDCVLIAASMVAALWVRYDCSFLNVEPMFWKAMLSYMPFNIVLTVLIFMYARMYTILWRFASIYELKTVLFAVFASTVEMELGMRLMGLAVPRSYPFLYFVIMCLLIIGTRFSYRFLRIASHNRENAKTMTPVKTMIVGAGAAGYMIVREMKNSKHLTRQVCCIIDDDPKKIGTYMQGIPVVGGMESIPDFVDQYDIEEIVIAIPTLPKKVQRDLLEICQKTECKILILPGIYQLVTEEVSVSQLRAVQIEDLLGRDPVNLEMDEIKEYVTGRTILVTGGGGSIGSELCRQIALHRPAQLIIFDIYENNAYDIQNELRRKYPDLNLEVLIGSVRDEIRLEQIFEAYRPELIFHAAAHKHVPLMEDSPLEAIKNNVQGTYLVAKMADKYHAGKMVLISTDKAVRPTNVMGASKRLCEMVIQCYAQKSDTEYAAVRFGNVLGSNGSVIPLFRKQIEQGGPVTVTHPDVIRYFMTIPEAVNLVLQCGALAHKGEIFILDMGEPVRILDLATRMIRLSGLTPGVDIEIKFTGLRPGEKLYEELLINEKNLVKTDIDRVFVVQLGELDDENLLKDIESLVQRAFEGHYPIRREIQRLVPEYRIPKQNYTGAEQAREEAVMAAERQYLISRAETQTETHGGNQAETQAETYGVTQAEVQAGTHGETQVKAAGQ